MKMSCLRIQIYPFLLLLGFTIACNGQVKTNLPKESINESREGQPKIVKTQGTGPGANVRCGLQDKAGNLWFGTTGEGVYRYDGKSFVNFTVKDGLSHNYVWSVLEDNAGNIWFGTADGACRYDGKSFIKIPIAVINGSNKLSDGSLNDTVWIDSYGNPSEENAVWAIIQDKTGMFWFGTNSGLYRYDGKSFTPFLHSDGIIDGASLRAGKVEYILEDRSGNIWFGGRGSKGVFHFNGKSLTSFKPDGDSWLWPVLEDRAGNIWLSSFGAVYRYDGKSFDNFTKKEGSCNNIITCIYEDEHGNIWSGSDAKNGGLCRYDGKGFAHYTTEDGLINNSVRTIVGDRAGNLWIGTRNTGLCRYDGKAFVSFST